LEIWGSKVRKAVLSMGIVIGIAVLSLGLFDFMTKMNTVANVELKTEPMIVKTWRDEPVFYNGKGILGTEIYSVYQLTNVVIRYPHDFTNSRLMEIESEVRNALSFAEQEGATDEIKGQLEQALTLSRQTYRDKSKEKLVAVHAILFLLNKEFNAGNVQLNQNLLENRL
jgi:hypothetical protein